VTRWSMGDAEELLSKYAWCVINASSRLHPVGTLRPNDLGIFDMHGNAWEWCQEWAGTGTAAPPSSAHNLVADADLMVARSGGFGHGPLATQSVGDIHASAAHRGGDLGFRAARTFR
jgi:formylglycine-generating enzyme required for sulfatase activity